ncbi:MAG: serine hydrolase [Clostridia bacterium]|nr:serine hydrolase [Clostridia bacterium]MBQ1659764.1 serine hydrolase [Clostridia bacterium]
MKKIISALSAVILAAASFGTSLTASAETAEKQTPSGITYSDIGGSIDSYIKEREAGLASCAVSVFDADGVVYDGYYGYADIENDIAANSDTVYEWGSTSKMLVWTSVMQQWERGNIDLEADIRDYLPDGFLTKLQYPDEKITMINLMSHNAGFQESFYENQEAAPDDVYDTLEDAVKACECWQASHVGEYTVYSNWGTALAAYIVEQTSGIDYVTYVNKNIFVPLGMEHSSIDPQQKDNEWVAEKRPELKCYGRYEDEKYNEDYGECRYAVQLFPAGACMSTLGDLSKFGQAFVTEDCPLFENDSTRDEMFKATSYFGDSDVTKTCHGLWTEQRKVQTLGHGGNTGGCTAELEFDPISGLGIAVLTNEPGETAFCSGIPVLLYGSLSDREGYGSFDGTAEDISGVYYTRRAIIDGAASASQYMGQIFPLSKNDDGTYSVKILGFTFADGIEFVPVAPHQYIYKDNGREKFVYIKDGVLELGFMDDIRSSTGILPFASIWGFILFGIVCLLTLIIKLIVHIIRKIRKSDKRYTTADKQILSQQMIFAVSGIIYAVFLLYTAGAGGRAFVTVSCILATLLGIVSLANGGVLCYNTIKGDVKARTKLKQFIWTALCIAYAVFMLVMQTYCFWKL